jgi:maleate isomerase
MFKPGLTIKSKSRNPDLDEGRHARAKLGFILMSTDLAAESDFLILPLKMLQFILLD